VKDQASNDSPELGENPTDKAVSLVKGTLGAIPLVGSMLAEMTGTLVPRQRMDRIEAYVLQLSERLQHIDERELSRLLQDPRVVDLFEDGGFQSARALSPERLAQIANLVAYGMSGDERERLEAKRLLDLMEEIDDDQIIILTSYLHRHSRDENFRQLHRSVLEAVRPTINAEQSERDRYTVYNLARDHLVRLGVLRPRFRRMKKGEVPEFDEHTGMLKASGRELTSLGRLLLTRIGLNAPGEF
jgi:hypothetical protein